MRSKTIRPSLAQHDKSAKNPVVDQERALPPLLVESRKRAGYKISGNATGLIDQGHCMDPESPCLPLEGRFPLFPSDLVCLAGVEPTTFSSGG